MPHPLSTTSTHNRAGEAAIEVVLDLGRCIPDEVIFVLTAVRNDQIELTGDDPRIVDGPLSGAGRHDADRIVRSSDVPLADAHLFAQDVLRNARHARQIGGSLPRRRDVRSHACDSHVYGHRSSPSCAGAYGDKGVSSSGASASIRFTV